MFDPGTVTGALRGVGRPAIPALISSALSDADELVRWGAGVTLRHALTDLRAQGVVLWWIVPRIYWKELR